MLWGRWAYAGILLSFTVSCNTFSSRECGFDPSTKRILRPWLDRDYPEVLRLLDVFKGSNGSVVEIAVYRPASSFGTFVSNDHGQTWHISDSQSRSSLNTLLPVGSPANPRLRSRSNPSVFWTQASGSSFELCRGSPGSKDRVTVTPAVNGKERILIALLISVSPSLESRLYARIKTDKEDFCIYRSNDSANTFTKLTCDLDYVLESQANPDVMVGIKWWSQVSVSTDGGVHWKETNDHDLMSPFRLTKNDKGENEFRTWESAGSYVDNRITQIESDPFDVNTFYVLTFKGLFVTHNLGLTYRLLPIATEFVQGVDCIGIDPVESRYLYASVKMTDLYRSCDKGCSWERVNLSGQ